jgi:hypothetical protein
MNLKQLETKMNKIILSLAALAAISTASFAAGNRSEELRDIPTYMGKFVATDAVRETHALAAINSKVAYTNFDRLNWNSEKQTTGGH